MLFRGIMAIRYLENGFFEMLWSSDSGGFLVLVMGRGRVAGWGFIYTYLVDYQCGGKCSYDQKSRPVGQPRLTLM
jgi:hypothetical protein